MRLRELEAQNLIKRRVYAEIPPRVEYSLTEKGRELQPVMTALHHVGVKWLEQENCSCPLTTSGNSGKTVPGKSNQIPNYPATVNY